jgi:hypothetical protein
MTQKRLAIVHSREKEGARPVEVLCYKDSADVIVVTEDGAICHAIDNPFTGLLYADDVYMVYGKRCAR